tara:strand:+ start:378 stop:554 length:177 start_codon:yes stop_codon:yes gene_type:complete
VRHSSQTFQGRLETRVEQRRTLVSFVERMGAASSLELHRLAHAMSDALRCDSATTASP